MSCDESTPGFSSVIEANGSLNVVAIFVTVSPDLTVYTHRPAGDTSLQQAIVILLGGKNKMDLTTSGEGGCPQQLCIGGMHG